MRKTEFELETFKLMKLKFECNKDVKLKFEFNKKLTFILFALIKMKILLGKNNEHSILYSTFLQE